jgi:hypothetical protein
MSTDPLAAALDQIATLRNHLADLDAREAAHHTELSRHLGQLAASAGTVSRDLAGRTAQAGAETLARLDALDRRVAELARQLPGPGGEGAAGGDGYQAPPAPEWRKLTPDARQEPIARLHDWVEHVFRPGYGHLAVLRPCWPQHDLCLYGLDLASQLWCTLYLQPGRPASLLAAQADYQVRILPALAAQLTEETTSCGHAPAGQRRVP